MGRPLDQASRVFGILKISELYILIALFLFDLAFLPTVLKVFKLGLALGLLALPLLLLLAFFTLSSTLPDRFFLNWFRYHVQCQTFLPGPELPRRNRHAR